MWKVLSIFFIFQLKFVFAFGVFVVRNANISLKCTSNVGSFLHLFSVKIQVCICISVTSAFPVFGAKYKVNNEAESTFALQNEA